MHTPTTTTTTKRLLSSILIKLLMISEREDFTCSHLGGKKGRRRK